jgi:hypothetical protein
MDGIKQLFIQMENDKRLLRSGKGILELMILIIPFLLLVCCKAALGLKFNGEIFNPSYEHFFYGLIVFCQ